MRARALVGEFELFGRGREAAVQLVGGKSSGEPWVNRCFVKRQGLLLAGGGVHGTCFARVSRVSVKASIRDGIDDSKSHIGSKLDPGWREAPQKHENSSRSST